MKDLKYILISYLFNDRVMLDRYYIKHGLAYNAVVCVPLVDRMKTPDGEQVRRIVDQISVS
jgi:hypothetical protein